MNEDESLQKNIRHAAGRHALKQIGDLVDKENADDAFKARMLDKLLRYGWLVLLAIALLSARYLGVI